MLARASPRKPMVLMRNRSSSSRSLLVAWDAKASGSSSGGMPPPSSVTRISARPPSSTSTRTFDAPASIAFSTSSFTTAAGRSITSPAAMRLTSDGDNCWMRRRSIGRIIRIAALASNGGEGASGPENREVAKT
jgi:hypothetical protein